MPVGQTRGSHVTIEGAVPTYYGPRGNMGSGSLNAEPVWGITGVAYEGQFYTGDEWKLIEEEKKKQEELKAKYVSIGIFVLIAYFIYKKIKK